MTIVAILSGLGVTATWLGDSLNLAAELNALDAKGRNVVIFQSEDLEHPTDISRVSCEALSDQSGVAGAGVIVLSGRLDVVPIGSRIPVYRASTTLVPELGVARAVVGESIGEESGSRLRLSISGGIIDAVVGQRQPEGVGLNSALVVGLAPLDRAAAVCIAVLDRFARAHTMIPVLGAQLDAVGRPLVGSLVLRESVDLIDRHLQRPTRHIPVLIGMLVGAMAGVGVFLRAGELASYRLSGTSATSLLIILGIESCLIGGLAAASAVSSTLVLWGTLLSPGAAGVHGLMLGCVIVVASIAVSAMVALRKPSDLAKDR